MNNFILINLNQTISKAELAALKEEKHIFDLKNKTVGQIKNITQEKKSEQNMQKKEN